MNPTIYIAVHRRDDDEPLMITRTAENDRWVWTNARTDASEFTSLAYARAAVVEFETRRGSVASGWYNPACVSIEPVTGGQS